VFDHFDGMFSDKAQHTYLSSSGMVARENDINGFLMKKVDST